MIFVRTELKKFQTVLSPDYTKSSEEQKKDGDVDGEAEEQRKSSREALLKITLHILRGMKQGKLADILQRSKLLEQSGLH